VKAFVHLGILHLHSKRHVGKLNHATESKLQ